MIVAETDRLTLRRMTEADAVHMLAILTDTDFVRFVGDRGVRTLEAAESYLRAGPMASYEQHGFGLYLVIRRDDESAVGVCGLLKRDYLEDVDVGYALLPHARGHGFALESVRAVSEHAARDVGVTRLLAIISPENAASRVVAERAGMREHRALTDTNGHEVIVYEKLLA
ncbi:MAG: GNAT family N-acetyltransferase [Gemmatimonadaceae bacterium]